jgi:release factor glutamine methyltransferase
VALPGVFRPISDSWQLAEAAANEVRRRGGGVRALEVGTGSGAIATKMALAGAEVTALDISRRALVSAWLTARLNGTRITPRRSSLFGALRSGEQFDLIVSNPPYVPGPDPSSVKGAERAWSAGPDGRALLDQLIDEAPAYLSPGGVLLMVHSTINGEDATLEALRRRGLVPEVRERHPGPVGPLMKAAGITDDEEEVLIVGGAS